VSISEGTKHLYTFDWLFGFVTSIVLYTALSWIFPAKDTVLTETIWNNEAIDGVQTSGSDIEKARGPVSVGGSNEKHYEESDAKPL
jgi:NCS1 family nucleobase:cation symporter-1